MSNKKWANSAERSTQGTFVANDEPRDVRVSGRMPQRVADLLDKVCDGRSRSDGLIDCIEIAAGLDHDLLEQCPDLEWVNEAIAQRLRRNKKTVSPSKQAFTPPS